MVHLLVVPLLLLLTTSFITSCGRTASPRFLTILNDFVRKYEGLDNGKSCRLFVHREWFEGGVKEASHYRVEVSTSYEHSGQGLGKVILKFVNGNTSANVLEWAKGESGEFLRVLVDTSDQSLQKPSAFRLKWMHFDHLHDATCSQLHQEENS